MSAPVEWPAIAAAVRSLDLAELAARRWYAAKEATPASASLAHAFVLADDAVLALVDVASSDGAADASIAVEQGAQEPHSRSTGSGDVRSSSKHLAGSPGGRGRGSGARLDRYAIPFVVEDGGWREAGDGDGAWRALAAAIAEGRTIPALPRDGRADAGTGSGTGQVDAALVCRPSPGFAELWGEEPAALATTDEVALGRDQSNTSVVRGGALGLKG